MSSKAFEAAVNDLALSLSSLIRRIRSAAPSELSNLSWTQKSVLVRLYKDGPLTIAELARAEGVKPQSMSTAVAALEDIEIVTRKSHPTDGRQTNILLTAKGRTIRKETSDAKHAWLEQTIATLNKDDQATLFAAGEIIKRLVEL